MIKNTVNNNNTKTNERKCTCKKCGSIIEAGYGTQIHSYNVYGFVCVNCQRELQRQIDNVCTYSYEHSVIATTQKNTVSYEKTIPLTNSIEFEIDNKFQSLGYNIKDIAFLEVTDNMKITHDGTVYAEIKTPIHNNLLALSKQLANIEKLTHLNEWNDATGYGTHFNVGSPLLRLDYVERFYHSLFVPFSQYLEANPYKCTTLFGRTLSHWCQPINENTNTRKHENFVNMQHSTHIEFRICKCVNANQYIKAGRCCNEIVKNCLIPFCEKFENPLDIVGAI